MTNKTIFQFTSALSISESDFVAISQGPLTRKTTIADILALLPAPSGGTVTSVGLVAPDGFSVAGSPITLSGNLQLSLDSQAAGVALIGPTSGGAATPTFRTLVSSDYPTMVGDAGAGGTKGAVPPPAAGDAASSKFLKADGSWAVPAGGGSMPGAAYAQYLAASLEPDAIEILQSGSFSYAVGSSVTKLLLASYNTRLGSSGRMEQRNPQRFMPLRGVTLAGLGSDAAAILLDPAASTYADPWDTYYDRLQAMAETLTRNVSITAASQQKPFLPGPYGCILTQVTCFNLCWLILRYGGTSVSGVGINLWDEISDAAQQRVGDSLSLSISKRVAGFLESGLGTSTGGSPLGSVSYMLCPSTWSTIADPVSGSYSFRDDFMGSSLNTGSTWTRTQSTAGNVEIDTDYQWCKIFGNAAWNNNGLYEQASHARSGQPTVVVDVFPGNDQNGSGYCMVGWNTGAGINYSDMAHGVNFAASGVINVYENGNARGTVGSGYTPGTVYRVKIQALSGGGATYSIQGGTQYQAIGSGSWTDITPGTTTSATSNLHAGATAYHGSSYLSDFRVF